MSRTFLITSTDRTEEGLKSSISDTINTIDADTLNEIVLAAASPAEENTIDMRKRKLESLQFQKEVSK